MLTLLVGPAASGKTARCIERIREVVEARDLAPVRVALPDRVQVRYFRQRLAVEGGGLGVQVGTFGDLYNEILERAGRPLPVANQAIAHRLLRAALSELHAQGRLPHYAPIAGKPGLLAQMRDHIAELKRSRVSPEAFLAALPEEAAPQRELGAVYAAYERQLSALAWTDAEGLGWQAIETLRARPELLAGWGLVVVDGFDDFVAAQRDAIAALAAAAPTLVTLPGEGEGETDRRCLRRFRRTRRKLVEALENAAPSGERRLEWRLDRSRAAPRLPRPMAHLERRLFEDELGVPLDPEGQIERIEARGPAEEAREVLRWLKARALRDEIPLDAMAIVTPEPERYRPLLRAAADEMGLPLRFTEGEPLIEAPAMAALIELLELPAGAWRRRGLVDSLRSPFFDLAAVTAEGPDGEAGGLRPADADLLEVVTRYGQVVEGLEQWEEALGRLARSAGSEAEGDEDEVGARLPHGPEAERLLAGLRRLAEHLAGPGEAASLIERVAWLERLLEATGFQARLGRWEREGGGEAPVPGYVLRERAALEQLRQLLGAMILGETLVASASGTDAGAGQAAFVGELRGMMEGMTLVEPPRWREPRILVARVIEARGPRFRALAMMALAEGSFPQVEREDPILDETLRERLNLESRLDRAQEGLFYLVATRADARLLLTRPYLAADGRSWEPSPYWQAAEALLAGSATKVQPDQPRPLEEAASPGELLFQALRQQLMPGRLLRAAGDGREALEARWARLRRARDVLAARLAEPAAGPWEGGLEALAGELARRYGPDHVWSASRLETYGSCPLRFLVASLLGLSDEPAPSYGPDAAQLGTLLHGILEQAYVEAQDPADPESVLLALGPVAERAFAEAPARLGFRPTPLWALEQAELREKLDAAVRGLAELEPGWTPLAHEQAFGLAGAPALEIEDGGERLRLRGFIDRLDRSADGRLRVVDYKTGSSHLAAGDLERGTRLQLPLYGLAARDALGLGQPAEGLYWAILAARPGALRLSRFEAEIDGRHYAGPEGAAALASAHALRVARGVRAGDFAPRPPADGCPGYCPAARWCWRYQAPRRYR